jgi:AcrR family transcriptional regulator
MSPREAYYREVMPRIISHYRDDARNEILRVGLEVLHEKGYCHTTMEEIARRLGVTKPALYRYFKNKDELIVESTKENHTRYRKIIDEPDQDHCPLESWLAIFDQVIGPARDPQSLYFEIISMSYRKDDLKTFSAQRMEEEVARTTAKIARWQEDGRITPRADARRLALALIGLFNGMRLQYLLGVEKEELREVWIENLQGWFGYPDPERMRTDCPPSCAWFARCENALHG